MNNVILKTDKLCKSFSNGGNQIHVLKNLDIEIIEGDFTIIMGSSGSGKSTLLYALSGMDKPTLGKVLFKETDISKLNNDKLAVFRRKNCGFVFQSIYLLDNMSVLDNVLTSGLLVSKDKRKIISKAKELLQQVGLKTEIWDKFPNQISGGEAQRAGIARALINEPTIIFADEPTGALNSSASTEVLNTLTKINENKQSIVAVTHDVKTACRGNRIIYIRDGAACGELKLSFYKDENMEARREKVQRFLDEMGW
ncbi:ABC transporter ATP-binding protein [Clostridium gelidum]|uniref:ABC transporter ATP-binding protein n=1 Tax=Clostridium gelidum TaxID=704125 RepID=A0ABM7T6R8_9CLOT|nr:ABC transporter ATP-binding protein [Clostridium gelidum]BCZ47710.1 ABC transporter ATP-binding protein [Clostridium gelidum]